MYGERVALFVQLYYLHKLSAGFSLSRQRLSSSFRPKYNQRAFSHAGCSEITLYIIFESILEFSLHIQYWDTLFYSQFI